MDPTSLAAMGGGGGGTSLSYSDGPATSAASVNGQVVGGVYAGSTSASDLTDAIRTRIMGSTKPAGSGMTLGTVAIWSALAIAAVMIYKRGA